MSNTVIVGDVHIKDNHTEEDKEYFVKLFESLPENVVFVGDLFNSTNMSPATRKFIYGLFKSLKKVYYIDGNHDVQGKASEWDLLPETAKLHTRPLNVNGIDFFGIPYQKSKSRLAELINEAKTRIDGSKLSVLILHNTPKGTIPDIAPYQFEFEDCEGFDYVFCGHIHINLRKTVGKTNCIMTGNVYPLDGTELKYRNYLHYLDKSGGYSTTELQSPMREKLENLVASKANVVEEIFIDKTSIVTKFLADETVVIGLVEKLYPKSPEMVARFKEVNNNIL